MRSLSDIRYCKKYIILSISIAYDKGIIQKNMNNHNIYNIYKNDVIYIYILVCNGLWFSLDHLVSEWWTKLCGIIK